MSIGGHGPCRGVWAVSQDAFCGRIALERRDPAGERPWVLVGRQE